MSFKSLNDYLDKKSINLVKYPINKYPYAFTKYPQKSGLNMNEFMDLVINYNITKNLKCNNLQYINYFCAINNNVFYENFDDEINNKLIYIGRVVLGETTILYKCIKNGEIYFRVKPYTAKFGEFISNTTSKSIMKFVNYFTDNELLYTIDKIICRRKKIRELLIENGLTDEKNENEKCSICLDDKTDCKTKCGHIFHYDCLKEWIQNNKPLNKNCPYCRQQIIH